MMTTKSINHQFTRLIPGLALTALLGCSDDHDPVPPPPPPDLSASVQTVDGPVRGQSSERAQTWEWLGLPYAAPPVGDLRWRAPQIIDPWSSTLDSTALAPECPQINFFGAYVGDEDCLHVNVWRPQSQERDLPVMVWVHGGGNDWGSANFPVYNGARLAEHANIVVVTIQYRLGPLGWLYFPPLQDGTDNDNSGNFGTLDIIAALQWVSRNIEVFGGNPEEVTLAGESAGGADTLSLLLADQARGLFHRAIVQSAGGRVTSTQQASASVGAFLDNLMALEGAPSEALSDTELASYLHAKSAEELVRNNPGLPAIFADGHVLPIAGFDLFDTGSFPNKVPLLIGTNKDEFKLYTNPLGFNVLPDASNELREVVGRYVSDLWRVSGADSIASRLRALPDYPDIYVYRFNWGSPDAQGNSPLPFPFGPTGGAHHAAELPFMFANWDTFLIEEFKDLLLNESNAGSRESISSIMVDYWGSFIHQGDPNGGNLPAWSPWSNTDGEFKAIVLDVNYADDQPLVTSDNEVWTVETVLADIESNVMEPLLSELMPYLENWLD